MALTQITTDGIKDGTITGTDLATSFATTGDFTFTGANYNVLWDKSDNALEFAANAKAVFAGDLTISHTGDHGNIVNTDGNLNIKSQGTISLFPANDNDGITIVNGGAVSLFHSNVKKFETTSDGVTVQSSNFCVLEVRCTTQDAILRLTSHNNDDTDWAIQNDQSQSNNLDFRFNNTTKMHLTSGGDLHIVGNLDLEDNDKLLLGTGDDLQIYHDGSDSYVSQTGTGNLIIQGNASNNIAIRAKSGEEGINLIPDGAVELYHNNSKKFETTSTGTRFPEDAYFVGAVSDMQWDSSETNLKFFDNVKAVFGGGDDLQIYHDGSNSYLKNAGTGTIIFLSDDVVFKSDGGGNTALTINTDAAVELYHNNSKKFETTSTGITARSSGDFHFKMLNGVNEWAIYVQDNNMRFMEDATERMRISTGGNIGAPTGSNIYNASDQRLKKNITTLTNGLDKIKSLNPVSFNWIDGFCDEEKDKTLYGVIAQEAQIVDSNLVNTFATGTVEVEGQIIENTLTVNEKFIIPLLIKAVQELTAKVEALEAG